MGFLQSVLWLHLKEVQITGRFSGEGSIGLPRNRRMSSTKMALWKAGQVVQAEVQWWESEWCILGIASGSVWTERRKLHEQRSGPHSLSQVLERPHALGLVWQ